MQVQFMAYWDVRDAVARVEGPRQAGRPTAAVICAATRAASERVCWAISIGKDEPIGGKSGLPRP